MFARNDKISGKQQRRMLVLDIFSLSSLIIPYIAVKSAGIQGVFVVLAGTVLAVLYGGILYFCAKKCVDHKMQRINFMAYSRQTAGSAITSIIGILYLVKLFLMLTFCISLFTQVISTTLLVDTNVNVIAAILLLVSGYGAMHSIEKRARLAEMLYILVMVPLVLYLLLGIPRIDLSNLFTGTEAGQLFAKNGFWWGSYFILLTFSALEGIIFTHFHVRQTKKEKYFLPVLGAIGILGVANLLLYIVTVGMLGTAQTGSRIWSSVTIMQIIEIPGGFVRRQDKIMLAFWMLGMFNILSYCFFYMVQITKDCIGQCLVKGFEEYTAANKYIILVYGILAYGLAVSMNNIQVHFVQFGRYLLYIGLPQSIIIPVFLVIINKIRKGKVINEA